MYNLPLINVYPIQERNPNQIEIIVAKYEGRVIPPRIQCNTPLEFAEIIARDYHTDNELAISLAGSLHEALGASCAYKKCKASMPKISQCSHIHNYRNQHPHYDFNKVNNEVIQHGKLLSPNQVLFRGGIWLSNSGIPILNKSFKLTNLLSTSLCPQVAAVHANCHGSDGFLWVITIDKLIETPAFVFNNDKRQKLGHELEVLFAAGATVICTSIKPSANLTVLEVTLR